MIQRGRWSQRHLPALPSGDPPHQPVARIGPKRAPNSIIQHPTAKLRLPPARMLLPPNHSFSNNNNYNSSSSNNNSNKNDEIENQKWFLSRQWKRNFFFSLCVVAVVAAAVVYNSIIRGFSSRYLCWIHSVTTIAILSGFVDNWQRWKSLAIRMDSAAGAQSPGACSLEDSPVSIRVRVPAMADWCWRLIKASWPSL